MPRLLVFALFLCSFTFGYAVVHTISSPNERLVISVSTDEGYQLQASYDGRPLIEPAPVRMTFTSGRVLGAEVESARASRTGHDAIITPVIKQKRATVRDHYRQLTLSLPDYDLEVRVFDDGFGYRFATRIEGQVEVVSENAPLKFPAKTRTLFPEEESFKSHNERYYLDLELPSIDDSRFCSLPVMFTVPGVARVVFTEADLYDYPGMFLRGTGESELAPKFPPYPLKIEPVIGKKGPSDRHVVISEAASYAARTTGARSFPWRTYIVSDDERAFLTSQLVFLLSRESSLEDTSWIKPGTVAWDWYNATNLTGVDFESGINNATYKYYIDFASRYGIDYIILDAGWSATSKNLFEGNPQVNVPELVAYGEKRGVGVILWALSESLINNQDAVFDHFQQWGVKGVKVDYMQRNDQPMVNFYEETARSAAQRHLLIDFHGSFKPSGLRRAYPNVITYEGVKGNENNKWSSLVTPGHNVTIPFIRMAAGPMDYTPGSMSNAQPKAHRIIRHRPMSIGTRCHTIAKYVIYESALQMFCDSPSNYLREAESTGFMSRIPTVWDETKPIFARVGEHVVVARRNGANWYVGAMTNEEARDFKLPLDFLGAGAYRATIMRDGINAAKHAEDYKQETRTVTASDSLDLRLAPSGGWAAIFEPVADI